MYAILYPFLKPARIVGFDKTTDHFQVVCSANKTSVFYHPADLTVFVPGRLGLDLNEVVVQNCGDDENTVFVKTINDAFNVAAAELDELIDTGNNTVQEIAQSPEMASFAKALNGAKVAIVREAGLGIEVLLESVANLFPAYEVMIASVEALGDDDEDDSETTDDEDSE